MKVSATPLVLFCLLTGVPLMTFIMIITLLPTPQSAISILDLRRQVKPRIRRTDKSVGLRPAFSALELLLEQGDGVEKVDKVHEEKRVVLGPLAKMKPLKRLGAER